MERRRELIAVLDGWIDKAEQGHVIGARRISEGFIVTEKTQSSTVCILIRASRVQKAVSVSCSWPTDWHQAWRCETSPPGAIVWLELYSNSPGHHEGVGGVGRVSAVRWRRKNETDDVKDCERAGGRTKE
ncbi:unnamed protein product [Pleuronectes platessa]|uniref:Uncharacterized protein n=1 Tax=Pleuronectes platessa TaxID=8262 RepID=A0A9N7TUK9_PLEPL|nr:unnamed protein product [Pleuronectes platessa]